ncbi:hypothetical protein B566_EDAN015976 [Ephemera danica]|nr:hypothetical protein B566_EDAN015976 [Ephemera danica]
MLQSAALTLSYIETRSNLLILASLAMVASDSLLEEEEEEDETDSHEQPGSPTLKPIAPHATSTQDKTRDVDDNGDRESWLVGGQLGGKNTFLQFRCSALADQPENPPAYTLHMTYKTIQAETKLISAVLHAHGMREVSAISLFF